MAVVNGDKAYDWKAKVLAKQNASRERIPPEWLLPPKVIDTVLNLPLEEHPNRLLDLGFPRVAGILSDRELSITSDYAVSALLSRLADGTFTALEVTTAFCKRAAIAGQLTSCLTETYFSEAQERAKQLDGMRAQGRLAGPLHGLPVSVKDGFRIRGSEATIGFVSYLGKFAEKNSPLIEILLNLGAVIHVKTNIPMTLMSADSHNNIFGRTLNPHNTALTAGGSSGGEGALIAFRGSVLGIGTDIAGSIRIPSLCDGTYGFKPTTGRIPSGDQASPTPPGYSFFQACAGPLAVDLEALTILVKAILDSRPATLDTTALDVPWRSLPPRNMTSMRIGILAEDPIYPLQPPVSRTLSTCAEILRKAGIQLVPLSPAKAKVAEAVEIAFRFFGAVKHKGGPLEESGEEIVPSVIRASKALSLVPVHFFPEIDNLTEIETIAALNVRRLAVAESWRELWNEHNLDSVIGPAAQHTAVRHDQYTMPPYTTFLNTLDYPACVIPFSRSSKIQDPGPFTIGTDQCCPAYEPDLQDGAPCAIQVFTSKMRDEECLEIATVIDECLKRSQC